MLCAQGVERRYIICFFWCSTIRVHMTYTTMNKWFLYYVLFQFIDIFPTRFSQDYAQNDGAVKIYPCMHTPRCFDVCTTSVTLGRRLINVKTTSHAYWDTREKKCKIYLSFIIHNIIHYNNRKYTTERKMQ